MEWGCGAHASRTVQVFCKDQHRVQCSFVGDSPRFSWNETQAREVSERLVDLFVGISQFIQKGRNGEVVWGWLGLLRWPECFSGLHCGGVGAGGIPRGAFARECHGLSGALRQR